VAAAIENAIRRRQPAVPTSPDYSFGSHRKSNANVGFPVNSTDPQARRQGLVRDITSHAAPRLPLYDRIAVTMTAAARSALVAASACGKGLELVEDALQSEDPGAKRITRAVDDAGDKACHMVDPEKRSPRTVEIGPAFRSIADTPGMTATALRVFLTSSHPKMPNLIPHTGGNYGCDRVYPEFYANIAEQGSYRLQLRTDRRFDCS
jgi:hypothetical protein